MTSGGSTPILRQHTKATLTVFICVAQKLTDTNNDYDYDYDYDYYYYNSYSCSVSSLSLSPT